MMTEDEEDLEEELRGLGIREDHGAEDSDVTPINTPPCTPPNLYLKNYPPIKSLEERFREIERHPKFDDSESRSESSLSWGDDEFEGEATRQVGALFDQLDSLLYNEEDPLYSFPPSLTASDSSISSGFIKNIGLHKRDEGREMSSERCASQDLLKFPVGSNNLISPSDQFLDVDESPDVFYSSSTLVTSASPVNTPPSLELQEECSDWVIQFPHFRARGYQLSSGMVNLLDQCLNSANLYEVDKADNGEEETFAQDGDFYHLLPLVTCNSANHTKENSPNPKHEASSSRVCSGSNDPEVLKEQVLIMLFNRLWSSTAEIIEPLLHQYAKYVIEQSVQYSSLSRESSTRGPRVGNQVLNRKWSEELDRTKSKLPMPSNALHRPISGAFGRNHSANKPVSAMRRPVSATNRLHSSASVPDIYQEELEDLLQVSPKLLQSPEEKIRRSTSSASNTRGSSAQSFKSQLSLPSLTTPRTPVHRPLSSRAANHLLTPMKVEAMTSMAEQRPASTSSCQTRARFHEKLHHFSRHGTIQESRGDGQDSENDDEPSAVWSRHNISFLPPISDSSEASSYKQPQSPVMTRGSSPLSTLNVRGKPLLAAHQQHTHHRAKRQIFGTPIIEGGRSQNLIHPSYK